MTRPSGSLTDLVRPVAVPVVCAALLTALLSVWVVTGGGGTLRKMPLKFELAAIASPAASPGTSSAATYLVIKNLAGPYQTRVRAGEGIPPGRLRPKRGGTQS